MIITAHISISRIASHVSDGCLVMSSSSAESSTVESSPTLYAMQFGSSSQYLMVQCITYVFKVETRTFWTLYVVVAQVLSSYHGL